MLKALALRCLILKGNVPEKMRHRLLVMDSSDGLGNENGYINRLDLVTLQFLQVVRHCVGHDNLK